MLCWFDRLQSYTTFAFIIIIHSFIHSFSSLSIIIARTYMFYGSIQSFFYLFMISLWQLLKSSSSSSILYICISINNHCRWRRTYHSPFHMFISCAIIYSPSSTSFCFSYPIYLSHSLALFFINSHTHTHIYPSYVLIQLVRSFIHWYLQR